jgi:hypothetical protein
LAMCLLVNQVKNFFVSLCRESGCHKKEWVLDYNLKGQNYVFFSELKNERTL